MSGIEKAIEELILNAMKNGDFNNLKGEGKPLDLSDNYGLNEVSMGNRILKNANIVPPEVELMNQIALLKIQHKEAIESCASNIDKIYAELIRKQNELAVRMEVQERFSRQ